MRRNFLLEWLTCIRKTIIYIEAHLHDDISVQDIGKAVNVSPMFLQKGFSIMTGYGIGEYMRNRRLYQAAIDLCTSDDKIIDIAHSYTYETPESFTKAFTRFHGATPSQIRMKEASIKTFLPIKINISISGGYKMEYKIRTMSDMKLIGIQRSFLFETSDLEIPAFWDEIFHEYAENVIAGKEPANQYEKAICDNHIGEYGICIEKIDSKEMCYMIAGKYETGKTPEGMCLYDLPDGDWAVFDCVGALPEAIQDLSNRIFREWLVGNPDYELRGNAYMEWYDDGNRTASDYRSAVWIPVKKKGGN
jgi:AraC family transcriptional regulator